MRLTKDLVGKKFRSGGVPIATLIAVDEGEAWIRFIDGTHSTESLEGWELVPETKKPSERIQELVGPFKTCGADVYRSREEAIIEYLDEQHEAKK